MLIEISYTSFPAEILWTFVHTAFLLIGVSVAIITCASSRFLDNISFELYTSVILLFHYIFKILGRGIN